MSSNSPYNSALEPIAGTSQAAMDTDNETTGIMGPPKITASAPIDENLNCFVENLIEKLNRIPDPVDRNAARGSLTKYITDRVNEVITPEELDSSSESESDSDSSGCVVHQITTLDDKLNKSFAQTIFDMMKGITVKKRWTVYESTVIYIGRLSKKRRRSGGKNPPGKRCTTERERATQTDKEHGKAAERNDMVKQWIDAYEI